jgi:ABC-type sulfate transport system substrate-binding protein
MRQQFPARSGPSPSMRFRRLGKAFPTHFKDGGSFDQIYQQK